MQNRSGYLTNRDVPGSTCCQLVTALNALIYFDRPLPSKYVIDILVDVVGCRHGSAIDISSAWNVLGLNIKQIPMDSRYQQYEERDDYSYYSPTSYDWMVSQLKRGNPIAISGMTSDWGYHSSLAIGIDQNHLSLVNWEKDKLISNVLWDSISVPRCNNGPVAFHLSDKHPVCLDLYPR